MAFVVPVHRSKKLSDYSAIAHLAPAVSQLELEAQTVVPKLKDRTVWMVNSTPQGGGVAEMLPPMINLMRELGIKTEWAVIESDDERFFHLTKRIHNLIHGIGEPTLDRSDRELFEAVNAQNAEFFAERLRPGDIVIVHDPQPMPLARFLREHHDVYTIWRCHIGLDERTPVTAGAWKFLEPYSTDYNHAVFSAPEYIPKFFGAHSSVIFPAINPLVAKNRPLNVHEVVGVLANAALISAPGPILSPNYERFAQRLSPEGRFFAANQAGDFGLLTRPIVLQVSRWDRLKGFAELLDAFVLLKAKIMNGDRSSDPVHRKRQELVRLVLAGPDPESIQDDPEAQAVLDGLCARFCAIDPIIQESIAIITLPMASVEQNALMVNALQSISSLVVQNSLREGFGLTIAEAMWKRVPVLSNSRACGPRQQIRDGVDGLLVDDPTNVSVLGETIDRMLADHEGRTLWAQNAQRHVHERFLVFNQVCEWLRLVGRLMQRASFG